MAVVKRDSWKGCMDGGIRDDDGGRCWVRRHVLSQKAWESVKKILGSIG
jgi:hypothetical protein